MSHYKELKRAVTNLDLSKRLKYVGCDQKSLFYWRVYEAKNPITQLCIKESGGNFTPLWGGSMPKKVVNRKMFVYSAYLSGEVSELLRGFHLNIVCHTHEKGLRSPYVCFVIDGTTENTDYPHILENNESDAKGLMLKMLMDKKTY